MNFQEKLSRKQPHAISGAMTRRNLVKGLAGAGVALPALGALGRSGSSAAPRRAIRRQDQPASLNMLYATVEADVEAIRLAIPDFTAETGHRHRARFAAL